MKILVVCQYYYPEPFRISDMCEELVQLGHDVTVVTGIPNYPMGEIYEGYEHGKRTDEIIKGVKVHRCRIAPRKNGSWNRLKNYFSYAYASRKYIKTLSGDFDVVFVNQLSPVMMAEAGIVYKKKHNKKMVLYCLDLWPESLCAGGIRKDSLLYKIFWMISRRMYRSADEILITSQSFRKYLQGMFDIAEEKIHYLPQYAEMQFLELKEKKQGDQFQLLFAGNLGTAQGADVIIDAARLLQNEDMCFHIVGDGIELKSLQKQAEGLSNVIFHGRQPMEEMPKYYDMADAMLVTLMDNPILSLTLPGKIQTYMAAGKPIVGAIDGEAALILNDAQGGYCGPSGDAEKLAENILRLRSSGCVMEIGKKNREYYLRVFSKERFMDGLLKKLM